MARRRDQRWRDEAAAGLLLKHLSSEKRRGSILVMAEPLRQVAVSLGAWGHGVSTWNRRALVGGRATPWPPQGPFDRVSLRLPRAKEELAMCLHPAAAGLAGGGCLLVYGAKDEGIQTAPRAMSEIFRSVETVAVGGHCRVLLGTSRSEEVRLRGTLEEWKSRARLDHPDLPPEWVSYPGVFAHGRLDEGTRLLLDALPPLAAGARVLDFGCGSGVVGYVARARGEGIRLELLDLDAVALHAAKENVSGARLHLRDGLPPSGAGTFDAILSNPPFHTGKTEDRGLLSRLVEQAPSLLGRDGRLVFVTQRRIKVEEGLRRSFLDVTPLREDSVYRVWMGEGPRVPKRV